jgi:predicted nucleic acid-binding protein
LTGEPAAGEVETLLRDETDPTTISAVNLAEALDVLVRHQGWPVPEVEEKLRWLTLGGLRVLPVDEGIGLLAGRLHARYYHRDRRPLSMADCVALASAIALGQRLATSDPALLATAVDEDCQVRVLLDSQGKRPTVGRDAGDPERSDHPLG